MTKLKEKLMEEFWEKFAREEKNSKTGFWWVIPISGQPEVASLKEVGAFLSQAIERVERETRKEVVEQIEKVFDDFRTANQKDKNGKRRFGVPEFKVNARKIHQDILNSLSQAKEGKNGSKT